VIDRSADLVVVGAGVSGLTTTLALLQAGYPVRRLVARELPAQTTSACAGAIWGPHLVQHGDVEHWATVTLKELTKLAGDLRTGIKLVSGVEASAELADPPSWMRALDGYGPCWSLPDGFRTGWRYTVPIVDMPTYLDYLVGELACRGVHIEWADLADPAALAALGPIVVNCTGLGSRKLLADTDLTPVRGDLVRVDNPGIEEFFAEHTDATADQTYILPVGGSLLLGGTAAVGELSREPDAEVAARVVERCARVDSRLRGALVREHRVGIRPNRTQVRLERESVAGSTVIHNYGHGGSGVSLSWGCAEHVVELVREATGAPAGRSMAREHALHPIR